MQVFLQASFSAGLFNLNDEVIGVEAAPAVIANINAVAAIILLHIPLFLSMD